MFDLSWSEILLIGTVAIVFIGPKELPNALRTAGQWAAKARTMAREFQGSVDDMVRESEIASLKNEVEKFGSGDLARQIEQTVDPKGEINQAFATPDFTLESPVAAPAAPPPMTAAEPPATGDTTPKPA